MIPLNSLQVLGKYPKLVGLADMLKLRANQLTIDHFIRISDAFETKLPITEETCNALLALFKGHNINDVADMIQSPDALADIVLFFTNGIRGLTDRGETDEVYTEEAASLFLS